MDTGNVADQVPEISPVSCGLWVILCALIADIGNWYSKQKFKGECF